MSKKNICPDCPFAGPKFDRRIIAKLGHIKREINTNNRLSDKSIERLKTILRPDPEESSSEENEYFEKIIQSIEENRNFDKLDDEQLFWVYELMEWAQWNLIEVDPETF